MVRFRNGVKNSDGGANSKIQKFLDLSLEDKYYLSHMKSLPGFTQQVIRAELRRSELSLLVILAFNPMTH